MSVNQPRSGWEDQQLPRWFPKALVYAMMAVTVFIIGRGVLASIRGFLLTLVMSLFLSFAMEPAVDWLDQRGWRRGPATGMVFLGLTVATTVLVWLMVTLVVDQVSALVDDAPRLIRRAADWANQRFDAQITTESVTEQIQSYQGDLATTAGDLGGRVVSVTGSVIGLVFQIFTISLFTFYLVADGPRVRRTVCSVFPPERQRIVLRLWELSVAKTGGYLYSRLLLAAVSATVAWIAFSIIGVPSSVALALFLGVVSQFVPVIGTYIGGAVPVVITLINDPVKALWVVGYILIYQQLENYLLAPRITARTMEIHPAVAFGAAIVGASVIGPVGALLALPAAAIIQAFVSSYINRYDVVAEDLQSEGVGGLSLGADPTDETSTDSSSGGPPSSSPD